MTAPPLVERVGSGASESFTGVRVERSLGPPPEDAFPGAVIAGKYRVERVIGEGAMGIVLAARHLELDELVAIKCIRPEVHRMPDVLSRFAREAKASAHLGSEHIVRVIDVGVAPPLGPYMVMEYLEGQNLAALLQQGGPLSVRRASEYVMQVCEALALAHAAGITHRDVKPENLFLTRRGDLDIVKVLDFGISKTALAARPFGKEIHVAETACLMGTPLYMSPEQIRGTTEVDHRTDLWSLGVVLFELLTGRPAFAGETVTAVCALVLEATPPVLSAHCAGASPELAAVIERCLRKEAAERFQNAAELANALLPFAPSRARLHAERSSSVLRGRPSLLSEPPSSAPLTPVAGMATGQSSVPATVFGAEPEQGWARSKPRALWVVLASVLALAAGFLGMRSLGGSHTAPDANAPVALPTATSVNGHAAAERATAPERDRAAPVVAPARPAVEPSSKPKADRAPPRSRERTQRAVPPAPRRTITTGAALAAVSEPTPPVAPSGAKPTDAAVAAPPRAHLLEERKRPRLLE